MTECVPSYDVLGKCIKDIISLIKPAEDDRNKRLSAIQELENSIQSAAALKGAAVKPFGSFLSNLYSKSGDLDLSVQLGNSSNLAISKKKKQNVLKELRRALQIRGLAGYMQLIPHARVPVLQYVSNRFGISCDLSIDNYSGRIKSKIFYWVNTLDERFGDMVLLIKEWAKAQNINDPKTGTLNSYSLCLLVLFHFQTCEPAILPPMKDIYEGNITEDFTEMTFYNEEHLDDLCAANIARFQSQNKEKRNESSLCHLLVTFFHKFSHIDALSSDVISTYTGQFERIQDNPSWSLKSYSLFVEDPVERSDNAARAVGMKGLLRVASAFNEANRKFVSLKHANRNDLLALLCTPGVGLKLGGRVIANSYTHTPRRSHQLARPMRRVAAKPSDNQHHNGATGFTGNRPVHNPPQVYANPTGRQTTGRPGLHQNHDSPQVYTNTKGRQTAGRPGLYQNHAPPVYANTGHQTAGQPGLYQNHNAPQVYTAGHQTAGVYQNNNHPVHTTWVQTTRPYQGLNYPQVYSTGLQTAGPYQSHNHPQVYTGGLVQTPGPSQNLSHHPPSYQTGRSYKNHQGRNYTPDRQANWNGVRKRYEPVLGGIQNGQTWDSRSQASSSRTAWQREPPTAYN